MTANANNHAHARASSSFSSEVEMELLCIAVSEVISSVSVVTGLTEREVMEILSRKNLNVLGEIDHLPRFPRNMEIMRKIGAETLLAALKESIATMAYLADVDCDTIVRALTRGGGKTIGDFVTRLRSTTWKDYSPPVP